MKAKHAASLKNLTQPKDFQLLKKLLFWLASFNTGSNLLATSDTTLGQYLVFRILVYSGETVPQPAK